MVRETRGGHNKKQVNENFFKEWSPQMAYVLGLIYADGTIIDARKSSRTCYLQISNNDKPLLEQVKQAMSSKHSIISRKPRHVNFFGKSYFCKENFSLRIGSRIIFKDLVQLDLTPRKSLTIGLPKLPKKHFRFFLRGYFDGDGCIGTYSKNNKTPRLHVVFVSGSYGFLDQLSNKLSLVLDIGKNNVLTGTRAFRISYRKSSGLKILSYMYKGLGSAPFLERKYKKFLKFLKT